jgi:hypothetical protein
MSRALLMCARCKINVRAHQHMGCLCEQCDAAIAGMTQRQLNADYAHHSTVSATPKEPTP